ncbi:MAG TPA: ATP-binding cassette domain-containing protein [Pseudonocardiaceae bacterium]|jgi:ABC-2 type transport system ATP-binding protein|nr:ATP-binding cassette domain-containing protein [Pseudonocardiaceae bacterium]
MIEATGLTKRYGSTLAVDDLSFTVQPGRVTGFLGPNGAGKSTTMRLMLGLDRLDAGEVRINGKRYTELSRPLHTVGALLDAKWTHPHRSARAHLRWLARSNKIPTARVDEVLGLVGLADVAGQQVGGYSLGMTQRLGIAAALLGDPQVLLFDEPVNGLDPEGISWIRAVLQSLAGQGRTVFVSSHLLSEMAITATELVVIGRGRLITQCSTAQFVASATETTVRVRSPQADQLRAALIAQGRTVTQVDGGLVVAGATSEEIGELAAACRVVLHELAPQRGSLEQAFIQMTGPDVEFHATAQAGAV